jgi:hypothetical protein
MKLPTAPYLNQVARWPREGRHILAHYDDQSVIVYQAYRPAIGHFAARHGYFGGEFSLARMSWVKPNFLWMMYRSGWGTKPNQEVTLAIRLRRLFFDHILAQAVPSAYDPTTYPTHESWQQAVAESDVRLQWDPDHDPAGRPLPRRAIQLGLRGAVLATYAQAAILEILDLSEFVAGQRALASQRDYDSLLTPTESVYIPADPAIVARLGLSEHS